VQAGETVVEVETDKATVEVEAPGNGVLVQILVAEGDTVALGRPVGILKPA
jgi:pyruvate dehydrogenase E2 component (dihydrolipoamide acetyltransferase)